MEISLHENYKMIDWNNLEEFHKGDRGQFKCVVCGNKTHLDSAVTMRGRNLVCKNCINDESKFEDGYATFFEWRLECEEEYKREREEWKQRIKG